MGFELDVSRVYSASGELLADGFVREHAADHLVVEAEHFSGVWLDPGDLVTVHILSALRGELHYDAVVAEAELGRVVVTQLHLREAVQKRQAVRVPTLLRFRTTRVVVDDEEREEQLDVSVQDVSATGMRVVCGEELPPGSLLELDFVVDDIRLPVRLRVLRSTDQNGLVSHGCLIEGLSERGEDALFSYVLAEQRRQRAAHLDAM